MGLKVLTIGEVQYYKSVRLTNRTDHNRIENKMTKLELVTEHGNRYAIKRDLSGKLIIIMDGNEIDLDGPDCEYTAIIDDVLDRYGEEIKAPVDQDEQQEPGIYRTELSEADTSGKFFVSPAIKE